MPMTPLAWQNLAHQPTRTAVSVGGIGFAIVLMFMQLGFLGAVGDTATNVYRRLPGDLILRSPEYLDVYDPRSIPEGVEPLVISLPEVAAVRAIDLVITKWQNPVTSEFRAVAVMAIDPAKPALDLPEIESLLPLLYRQDHILVDRTSGTDFGPVDRERFGPFDIGRTTDVAGRSVKIVGTFSLGTGLAASGAIMISREGFQRIAPGGHAGRVSMLIVDLAPGVTDEAGREAISNQLVQVGGEAGATQIFSSSEAVWWERWRWYAETPIGMIFAMGVALAIVVGGVICYMVLAADVLTHLPEYATLKAMGYTNGFLTRVLMSQAFWLAAIAFPPAIAASLLLYEITSEIAEVPIRMTGPRVAGVSLLTLVMCSSAGVIALRKLLKAEPANLF